MTLHANSGTRGNGGIGLDLQKESLMIRDFPKDERPRERFIHHGSKSLSNHELIAMMLRTGTKDESVLQLANRLLTHFGGFAAVKGCQSQ